MPPEQQEVYDLLPATGEITFDAWKQAASAANVFPSIRLWKSMKRAGIIAMWNVRDEDTGELTLYVGRPVSEPV